MAENLELVLSDDGEDDLARIRRVRHQISEQFGHDAHRLVAYLMELQKEHPERLVPAPPQRASPLTSEGM